MTEFEWIPGRAVVPYSTGVRSDSAVKLHDGRVLYVFTEGDKIKGSYAPTVSAFLRRDGSVSGVFTIFEGLGGHTSTVFRLPGDPNLYMQTSWLSSAEGSVFRNELYVATAMDGSSWTKRGDVQPEQDYSGTSVTGVYPDGMPGAAVVLPNGRWLMPGFRLSVIHFIGLTIKQAAVWYSDDAGATWTLSLSQGYYILGGGFGYANSRMLGVHDGLAYFGSVGQPSGGDNNLQHGYSTPDGINWTLRHNTPGAVGSLPSWAYAGDDVALYRMNIHSGNIDLYEVDPLTNGGETFVLTFNLPGTSGLAILQPLGHRWALMCFGRVISPIARPLTTFQGLPGRVFFHDPEMALLRSPDVTDHVLDPFPLG